MNSLRDLCLGLSFSLSVTIADLFGCRRAWRMYQPAGRLSEQQAKNYDVAVANLHNIRCYQTRGKPSSGCATRASPMTLSAAHAAVDRQN